MTEEQKVNILIGAAAKMLEAYEPSYSNQYMSEDGYGVSRRRDWQQDQRIREQLRKALDLFKPEVSHERE